MCIRMYELCHAKFLSALRFAWQAALKITKVKLDFLTDINILLIVEKSKRAGIYHSIYRYPKANNKYMKNSDKNNKSSNLQYWNVNNLYGWTKSQGLPVNNFNWIKDSF